MIERVSHPKMAWFREVYKNSTPWAGQPLENKTIIVYAEQGFGDIIQFARYLKLLKARKVYFHCPKDLHRVFQCLPVELLDKYDYNLPPHDYYVLSMELPFLTQQEVEVPYIFVDEKEDLGEGYKIGIAWEGVSNQSPLAYFKPLFQLPARVFSLQKHINPELTTNCGELELFGCPIEDFYDTAKIINSLDVVVSVDTSVLHLAGAMGKRAYCVLSDSSDPRWTVGINWYPSVTLCNSINEVKLNMACGS